MQLTGLLPVIEKRRMRTEEPSSVVVKLVARDHKDYDQLFEGIVDLRGIVYPDVSPTEDVELSKFFDTNKNFGVAAVLGSRVVGHVLGSASKAGIELHDLAVLQDVRRCRVGTELIGFIIAKMIAANAGRFKLTAKVREHNVPAQMFFKSMGFVCKETLQGYFEEPDEDAYSMVLKVTSKPVNGE